MGSGPRWLLLGLLVTLGVGEFGGAWYHAMVSLKLDLRTSALQRQSYKRPPAETLSKPFTRDEVKTFLAAAKQADAIKNPLQRCLAYPDPPRSHWSPAAVKAYCQYYLQPLISFADAEKLIQSGRAAELDRQLAVALRAQLTRPDSHGLLDHLFFMDFSNGSFDVRPTLDAWKRDSPKSAFAYAASGFAYVAMASSARGGAYIRATSQGNIDAMDRLLSQADTDLQQAVALNPQVTPAYVAMINAGSMSLGSTYVINAARHGLAVAPDDYAIYGVLSGAAEPKWGGSLRAMRKIAERAQAHVRENPLLSILLSAEPAYQYDVCNCASMANWSAFPRVFDTIASTTLLSRAGFASSRHGHPELAVIYLSEVLRFQPEADAARRRRDASLVGVGEPEMALDDANLLIAADPKNANNFQLRGTVYLSMGDNRHAEQDLEAALALRPDDIDVLGPLGGIYINETHEWDKGWDIADRIIRKFPNSPGGWVMRATIQENQPRAGLNDTYQYFVSHFTNEPAMQWQIRHMRQVLAKAPKGDQAGIVPRLH